MLNMNPESDYSLIFTAKIGLGLNIAVDDILITDGECRWPPLEFECGWKDKINATQVSH